MATVVHMIDTITEWARNNICGCTKLKQPPADLEAPTAEGYEYTLVTPAAFPMYVPTSEKLPPNIHAPFPSLCVRVTGGEDSMADSNRTVDVQICLSTWDTGEHGKDRFLSNEKGGSVRWSGAEADAYFKRQGDGWRDAWNFLDIALRAVESVTNIGGYLIDPSAPIKYGPLTEQESIPDLYPTWFAWLSFRVTCPLVRNNEDYKNSL